MPDTYTPREAATALHVSVEDLAFWRTVGLGPAYIKIGPTMIRYSAESLHNWDQGQLHEDQNECCPWCGVSHDPAQKHDTYSGDHDS